ncbi:fimbrial protein [Pseudomonas syringae USA007]|uniref:Fimbrial protein n=1 Tax=Pseudomonas syringae USA007 TaxID=1357288 RepID=A0AAU8MFA7_PSESX|nr:fimbrial protein [Pseudomonas syringae]
MLLSAPAQANCARTAGGYNGWAVADGNSVQIKAGRINLTSSYLQPAGTPLATTITSANDPLGWETVLFECDLKDKDDLYELFSTNGDDRLGGYWETGNGSGTAINDGLPGVYATFFPYVGLKITHMDSGKVFTRYWQESKITRYDVVGNKLQVKTKHLSALKSELIKVSDNPPLSGSSSNWCGYQAPTNVASADYTCVQPNAYVTFKAPGFIYDKVGSDHNTNYYFWGVANGIAYGLRGSATLTFTPTCVARNVTPVVTFPTISVQQLNSGESREADFTVELECSNQMTSGVQSNQTALGIQVSQPAFVKAGELGLVNSYGGVDYLLSNGYGADPSVATGVGISLRDSANGDPMNFVGWPGNTGAGNPGGKLAGWYPVLDKTTSQGSSQAGYTRYTKVITAVLEKLPRRQPTAGRVDATAYVLVKVQ